MMTSPIIVALVAGVTSIIVSFLTAWLTRRHYEERFRGEVLEKYNEKLIERRLDLYPQVFELSGKILEPGVGIRSKDDYRALAYDLRRWWVGPGAALLSEPSIKAYYTDLQNGIRSGRTRL